MHEAQKLNEAKYFYSRLRAELSNDQHFIYLLSAFLSSARSVLQYAYKECKIIPGGKQWYQTKIKNSNVLSFFKKKRDINIHLQPVSVIKHTTISLSKVIKISNSLNIKSFDQEGKLIREYSSEPSVSGRTKYKTVKITHRFFFSDWKGKDDVLKLCKKYIRELHKVITDGKKMSFLTK